MLHFLRYAFALYDNPDLSRLWKSVQTMTIGSGTAYIQTTPRLCLTAVEALNKSFGGNIDGDMAHYNQATCMNKTMCQHCCGKLYSVLYR